MRHLLTAALIATTLSSPAKGDIVQILCEWPYDGVAPLTFQIDIEQQTIIQVGSSDDWEITVLIWNDDFIGWADVLSDNRAFNTIKSFLLNRQSLTLQTKLVFHEMLDDHPLDATLQCKRPI